jgi:hypothetical protein
MRVMWLLMVASLRWRLAAISAFDSPAATSLTTSRSRSLRLPAALLAGMPGAGPLFGVLVSWYFQPEFGTGGQSPGYQTSPLITLFDLRQVTFPAWTVAAFAIGVLAGLLIRRVVPAIVATLAVYTGLAFVTAGFGREHYLTPLATTSVTFGLPGTSTAWILNQWFTKDGRFAFGGNPPLSILNQFCSASSGAKNGPNGFALCLAPHGYTQWTSYQPASRFWPFQWIEGGWLLALSALLIAAAVVLVHRRAA